MQNDLEKELKLAQERIKVLEEINWNRNLTQNEVNKKLSLAHSVMEKMGEALKIYFEQERAEALGYFGTQRNYPMKMREEVLEEALTVYREYVGEGKK